MKSFEQPSTSEQKKSFYRERSLEAIRVEVSKLSKLESSSEKISLESSEQAMLLKGEARLGKILENILYGEGTPVFSIAQEYLFTEEGKRDIQETLGISLTENQSGATPEQIFFSSRETLRHIPAKKRADLTGRARKYREDFLFTTLRQALDSETSFSHVKVPDLHNISILIKPEASKQKLRNLRRLKSFLKIQYGKVPSEGLTADGEEARKGIIDIYTIRINEAISGQLTSISQASATAERIPDALSSVENSLFLDDDIKGKSRNLSRLDKLTHGAAKTTGSYYPPLSEDLKEYARIIGEKRERAALKDTSFNEGQDIDNKKVETLLIDPEEVGALAAELLQHYNLLSAYPSDSYDSDRTTPAPDNKWQVLVEDRYKSMSVNGNQKVIKIPKKPQRVDTLITITLGHEIEGHVLQRENRELLPLQIFQKIGSGRSVLFAECGAMHNQKELSEKVFGKPSLPHPHYAAAIERRLQGGNLIETIEAFYKSADQQQLPDSSKEKLVMRDNRLRLAINRALRIFKDGENYSTTDDQVENSKDLVYLEQESFYEELERNGIPGYAYLSGVNFTTLAFLQKFNFIENKKIRTPDFYAERIWEKIKERYQK